MSDVVFLKICWQIYHNVRLFKHRTVYHELKWGKSLWVSLIVPHIVVIQPDTKAIHLLFGELRGLFRATVAHITDRK